MEIKYIVHSCSETDVAVKATVAGREVMATIPGLVVELTSDDESMGHTYRFTPDDLDEAKALFTIGAQITITFSKMTEE